MTFLDTLITWKNNVFASNTYRKPTFTGLGLNFLSCIPMLYKINTIKALIYRAYNLNSTFTLFHKEITFLLNYFKSNNFPLHIVHNQIKSFLNKIYEPKSPPIIVPKMRLYVKLPYFGYISDIFQRKSKKM